MSIVDRFTAYDENQNEYSVVVNVVLHSPHSDRPVAHAMPDYSLADTAEVLARTEDNSVFLIRSTGVLIVDIRGK